MISLPNQLELQSLFSGFLFETGLSAVSIKNYLSDLRHFFSFCASVSVHNDPPTVQEIFQDLPKYLELYLTDQKNNLTPQNTINRRSASIRRFSTFLSSKFGLNSNLEEALPSSTHDKSLPTISKIIDHFKIFLVKEKKTHSTVKNYISDLNHFFAWSANNTPFLDQKLENILSETQLNTYITYLKLSHTSTSVINRRQSSIKQFTRYCFLQKYIPTNPFEYKRETPRLLPLSWFERLTKKKNSSKNGHQTRLGILYQKYNSLPFTPYLHLAILVLATFAMATFGYNQIIKNTKISSAALPTVPRRQLSFQGRLTDSSGNPITTSVSVVFKLWNHLTAGSEVYNSNTCSITPDPNGIFNTLIGGGTCGAEIANTVFTENRDIYLEVVVGSETLTPRQQIATVGYALNSETLQGYPASSSATINTVPIVDDNGDINIAVDSPTINSTSGIFTLNGQSLTLTTTANSGGDIVLQPDAIGSGQILALGGTTDTDFLRIENANLTTGSLISGYVGNDTATGRLLSLTSGSTETDRFYVGADGQTSINTSATLVNAGLMVNQNSTGDLFTASTSGVTKFTINNNGNILATGTLTGLTGLTVASGSVSLPNGEINNAEISELDWTKLQNYPSACAAGQALQAVGDTLTCVDISSNSGNLWQLNSGVLTPLNITNALTLGATATNSAIVNLPGTTNKDAFFNIGSGNFGIGMTNPAEKLDVNGGIKLAMTTNANAGTLRYTTGNNLEIYDGTYWAVLNTGKLTNEITGFVDRTSTTLSFNNASPDRTFTITGTNFPIYIKSQEFIKNTESIQIDNTIGLHFIYYNSAGTLTESVNAWDLATNVPIATVYWNGTTGLIGEERHGVTMDHITHEYLHKTVGSRYDTGLGGTFTNTTFSIDPGSFYDEDLKNTITPAKTTTRVLYRVPAATSFTYTAPQTAYYTGSTGSLDYDNAGTRTAVPSNNYVAYWIFATNDPTTPIYSLMGQRVDTNLTNARNNATYQALSLANLPFAEMKVLYRVLVRNVGGTTPTFIETQDLRNISNLPSGTFLATAHGTLTGLLNDDHTQYALLAGRNLGQTLIGGDSANETLILQGNAGATGNTATSANLIFKTGDAGGTTAMTILNNGNIGMGLTNPSYKLDITGDINLTAGIRANGTFGNPGQVLSTTGSISQWVDAVTLVGGTNLWQINAGTVTPLNITNSLNLGDVATNSATVHLAGTTGENSFINTGNFGLGLTNPTYTLDVSGSVNITGSYLVNGSPLTASNWQRTDGSLAPLNITDAVNIGDIATNSALIHLAGTAGNDSFINNGNFGIGLTNPTYKLDIAGDVNLTGALRDNGSAGVAGQILSTTGTGVEWIDAPTGTGVGSQLWQSNGGVLSPTDLNDSVNLGATATSSATVHLAGKSGENSFINTGNFGIGDTTPAAALTVGNGDQFQVNSSGAIVAATGISSSGNINFSSLTASRAVFTDASNNLVSTAPSQSLIDSISDETGTGALVFGTSPTFTTDITTPLVIGGTADNSSLQLKSTSGVGTTDFISLNVGNNGGTEALRIINNGYVGIGTTTPSQLFQVGAGTGFLVNSSGAIMNANGATISGSVRFSSLGTGILHSDTNGYISSSALNLASDVTGVLPLINGGTNNDNSTPYVSGKFLAYDGSKLASTAYDENSFQLALTFQNGLTKAVNTVEFGGANPLLHDTNVDQGIYNMSFTGSGNFGIGAATPSQKLDVAGFFVVDTGNARVGIGTTAPTAKLEIAGSTSTISNTSGDITFNSASNEFDFSGDSLKNFLNATVSGQIQLGNFADAGRPATVGAGSLIYSTTQGGLQYSDGTNWNNITNYFNRNTEGILYPNKEWFDSINLFADAGANGATSSAKVRLSGDFTNNTFFVNPIAIGFTTAMDQPLISAPSPYTYALQVNGGILPSLNDGASGVDLLGHSTRNWKDLYLSDNIIQGSTAVIELGSYSLSGAVWHSTAGFKVADGTLPGYDPAIGAGLIFEVTGNASVSGTLHVGDQLTVGEGSGKIDVGVIDPPYTISGKKYATYMASMVGIKEEMVGKVTNTEANYIDGLGYRTLIDLDQQPVGSDVWLFSNTTNIQSHINDLSVLLTPEGQAKAWYEVDVPNKILAIYSSTPTNITYRLTAPRFDSNQWTNTRTSNAIGYSLNDSNNLYSNSNSIFNNPVTSPELIAKLDGTGTYSLKINGVENKEVSSFMNSIIANLKAGSAVIASLVTDNLTIRTKLISPLADIDQLLVTDATVSGTLYANNIKGQALDALHTQINLLNEKYSTSSAILADLQARYGTYDSLFGATSSAIISDDPLALSPLATESAIFPSDLALNSLNVHTLIGNDILANGSIFTNSLSAFDTDLFIQPIGNKPVHLLANLMTLYPDGKVIVNGDLLITGTIFTQGLDTNTATVSGTLAVGSSTISTESARFAQVSTDGLIIASGNDPLATIAGQTNSNATIGVATIIAGTTEISILNTKVTPTTLIYITPTSDTAGRVLFVKSKTEGVGFTVGITGDIATPETSFNYWLVETK